MSDWQSKSDFEINKAVALCFGYLVQEVDDDKNMGMNTKFHERYPNTVWVAELDCTTGDQSSPWEQKCFTQIADDAWPIISENKISIEYRDHKSLKPVAKRFGSNSHNIADDNVLRAAMIVYLEMNGVKP